MEEEGEVVARVGEPGFVHVDMRDSCGLPYVAAGATLQVCTFEPALLCEESSATSPKVGGARRVHDLSRVC